MVLINHTGIFLIYMRSLFIILFTFLLNNVYSQTYVVQSSPTLNFLYNNSIEVSQVSNTENLMLFPLLIGKDQAEFKLIRNTNGLYALVDGTGQVYKATNLENDKMSFTRIDSTKFFGNNFESISFSIGGGIYNFGGYGFWHMNGHICYFNKQLEWTIEKVNQEYRTVDKAFSYNPSTAKIYYVQFPRLEEHTIETDTITTIIEFDVVKRENKVLGKLDPKHNLSWKKFTINTPSLDGLLTYNTGDVYLYQFSNNKIYKLINIDKKNMLIGKSDVNIISTFEYNGAIYYSYSNDSTLRSLNISINDFELLEHPIYRSNNNSNFYWNGFLLVGLAAIIGSGIYYAKRKKSVLSVQSQDDLPVYNTDLTNNEFNEIERKIISNLIEKSNNNSYFNVEEFNSYLGIKKKTIEIQKRVRTEAINRINHKFNVNFNKETVFIERVRTNEDRRYFNYMINKENANIYLEKINSYIK